MKYINRLVLFIIIISVPLLIYLFYWNRNVVDLNVVFTSDGHGHILPSRAFWKHDKPQIGGLAALGGYLKKLTCPYLLTDSGDIFQGTPEGINTKGKAVVEIMNILGYDAVQVGNHEFDLGQEVLRGLSETADFSFLGANIIEDDTGVVPAYLKKYLIKTLQGIKIGLIGVITSQMEKLILKQHIAGLKFSNPVKAINDNVKILQSKGAEIIVVLSHLGLDEDRKIADKLNDVDVVLGAHSHRCLYNPIKVKRLLICQSGSNFINIGHLKLYYSTCEKKILSYCHCLVPLYVEEFLPHEGVRKIVEEMQAEVSPWLYEVIGQSEVFLPNHLSGKQKKHGELALGNWQTDLMREITESDLAFQNTGGIRASIQKGDIKVRDVWELSPFGNTLTQMTLTGRQIHKLLEQSVAHKYSKLQVSGLKVVYNNSLAKGRRVLNIIITDARGNKKEMDMEKEYTVITNSFLAQGGDGYSVFNEASDVNETAVILRDAEIEFIKNNSPIKASVEGRLVNVSIEK